MMFWLETVQKHPKKKSKAHKFKLLNMDFFIFIFFTSRPVLQLNLCTKSWAKSLLMELSDHLTTADIINILIIACILCDNNM